MILPFQMSLKDLLEKVLGEMIGWVPYGEEIDALGVFYVIDIPGIALWSLICIGLGILFTYRLRARARKIKDQQLEESRTYD